MKYIRIVTAVAAMFALSALVFAQPSYAQAHQNLQFQSVAVCGCGSASSQTLHLPGKGLGIQLHHATGVLNNCFCDSIALAELAGISFTLHKEIRFTVTPVGSGFNPNQFFVEITFFPPHSQSAQHVELSLANGGIFQTSSLQANGIGGYKLRTGNGANSLPLGSTITELDFSLIGGCNLSTQTAFLQTVSLDNAQVGILQNESSSCSTD